MDTIHAWSLWRLLMIGLITLPFLVAVVIVGFRQSNADGSNAGAGHDDRNASSPSAGPDAWHAEGDGRVENRPVDSTAIVEKRAA